MIRFGLCCIFREEPIKFRRTTAKHAKELDRKDRLNHISTICEHNAQSLFRSLQFCHNHDIRDFHVNSKNLSKCGMMIKCNHFLQPKEEVEINSPFWGKLKGVICWTRPVLFGRQLAGVKFVGGEQEMLNNFIHKHFGERYA